MNIIDLDEIILKVIHEKTGLKNDNIQDAWASLWMSFDPAPGLRIIKECIREAINQALVLVSEKAKNVISTNPASDLGIKKRMELLILDVEKLIK